MQYLKKNERGKKEAFQGILVKEPFRHCAGVIFVTHQAVRIEPQIRSGTFDVRAWTLNKLVQWLKTRSPTLHHCTTILDSSVICRTAVQWQLKIMIARQRLLVNKCDAIQNKRIICFDRSISSALLFRANTTVSFAHKKGELADILAKVFRLAFNERVLNRINQNGRAATSVWECNYLPEWKPLKFEGWLWEQ